MVEMDDGCDGVAKTSPFGVSHDYIWKIEFLLAGCDSTVTDL